MDWDDYLAKRAAGHPVADAIPGRPGFVSSPITGTIVDVNDIPPGTLVKDPSVRDGGIFRIPPAAEDE